MSATDGLGSAPALQVRDLSKSFAGHRALDAVNLEVVSGEVHAIVGQNGSGKSTLVKILSGYQSPDPGGQIEVGGTSLADASPHASWKLGMRFVHQDLGLVSSMSVMDNFLLGDRGRRILMPVDKAGDRARLGAGLAALGCELDPGAQVAALSESDRTALALARALDAWRDTVRLIVLDEATASMPWAEAERLFGYLRKIADDGVGVLFVSHHLDEVLACSDRVTVLRDGRRLDTVDTCDTTRSHIVEAMLGRTLLEEQQQGAHPDNDEAKVVLSVDGLTGRHAQAFGLSLRQGEIVGIAGLAGSGRDEIASLLSGRIQRSGTVLVDGRAVRPGRPRAAIAAGLCCVPANRSRDATLATGTVRENVSLADIARFRRWGWLRRGLERSEVTSWIQRMSVKTTGPDAPIASLSGGNQQKVILARWLRTSPKVLVLDEPTQGVDVGSKAEIHDLVKDAAAQGLAVLMCSSDSEELSAVCHRVLVMQRGRTGASLQGEALTSRAIDIHQLQAG